jgi:hypothetical protein
VAGAGPAKVIVDTEPSPDIPRDALRRGRIEVGQDDQIVPARKITFHRRIDSARAARDTKSGWRSVRDSVLAQRFQEFHQILRCRIAATRRTSTSGKIFSISSYRSIGRRIFITASVANRRIRRQ